MEAAVLHFVDVIEGTARKECEITPASNDWAVQIEWRFMEFDAEFVIEISRITPAPYDEFYADVVMCVVCGDCVTLRKSVKGPSAMIEIKTKCEELLETKCANFLDLAGELVSKQLDCEIRLTPFVPLKRSIVTNLDSINEDQVDVLINHISTLQNSREYDAFLDIVITSGNTSVKANKCILAARLPEFVNRITKEPLPFRPEDNLEEIRIDASAEPGLHQMMRYVYSNEYNRELISLGNLALTAEAMDSSLLKFTILHAFMKELTVETVFYAIYFTDRHGESKHRRQALMYMLDHFEEVQATAAWNNLQVIFACFHIRGREVSGIEKADILKIALKVHARMFYTLSDTQ